MSKIYKGEFRKEFNRVAGAFREAAQEGLLLALQGQVPEEWECYREKEATSRALASDLQEKFMAAGYSDIQWRRAVRQYVFMPVREKIMADSNKVMSGCISGISFNEALWFD